MKHLCTLVALLTVTINYGMNREEEHKKRIAAIETEINDLITYADTTNATVRAELEQTQRKVAALEFIRQLDQQQDDLYNNVNHGKQATEDNS